MNTRLRRLGASAALALVGAGALLSTAAPASAAPGDLKPTVSCYTKVDATTYRVFFGYENKTGAVKSIPRGATNNTVTASGLLSGGLTGDLSQPQPSTFETGSHPAVFSIDAKTTLGGVLGGTLPATATWALDDRALLLGLGQNTITFSSTNLGAYSQCGAGVELPGTGNPAAVAGLFGAVVLVGGVVVTRRMRRA